MIGSMGLNGREMWRDVLFVEMLFQLSLCMVDYTKLHVDVGLAMQGVFWVPCLRRGAVAISQRARAKILISDLRTGVSGKQVQVIHLSSCDCSMVAVGSGTM